MKITLSRPASPTPPSERAVSEFSSEVWEQARHRVNSIAERSRDRNPDTVMYLTMTELQRMFPTLSMVELTDLYASVKANRAQPDPRLAPSRRQ